MIDRLVKGIAASALVSLLLCVLAPVAHAQKFIAVRKGALVQRGHTLILRGATMYPYWVDGTNVYRAEGWTMPGFSAYINQVLDLAKSAGLNTIRPTDELIGASDPYDPTVWKNLDALVAAASKRHMYVILDLSAFRNFEQAHHLPGYDSAAWTKFVQFIVPRYSKDTNIVGYSIAGEVEAPNSSLPTRLDAAGYVQFFTAIEAAIHAVDKNHLIYAGGLSQLDWNGGVPWQQIFSLPYNSLCAVHTYSDGDRTKTVPMVSKWAAQHGKPFLIEEFGFQQQMGDPERAAAFENEYALADGAGACGVVFWNLGREIAPGSYDVGPDETLTWEVVEQNAATGDPLY